MSGINKVILIGNLGRDPEVRTLDNGLKRVSFSLATTETYKDKNGQKVSQTEWHNIICWRNLADIAEQYLFKGKQIYLEGKIRTRSWEDNGIKKYTTEIVADTFTMLGSLNREDASGNSNTPSSNSEQSGSNLSSPGNFPESVENDDDLPF